MINRILYWFITLPVFAKSGCLGIVGLLLVCSCVTAVTIPGTNARIAQRATQTAIAAQAQATAAIVAAAATSTAHTTVTAQAQADTTATSAAALQAATETAHMETTATAKAAQQATDVAAAAAATEAAVSAATATAASIPTPTPIPEIAYTELDRWERDGNLWVAIRIEPGIKQADLLRLAQQLRTKDPSARYHIFDDDAQIAQFKRWSLNDTGYPEDWLTKHYIALINQMFDQSKLQWKLELQQDPYASYPVELTTSVWGGKRGDGGITREEAAGWAALFMKQTETYACCVKQVHVTGGNQPIVTITLAGELLTRPEEARQKIASAAMIRFEAELGECPNSVVFSDTNGASVGDGYTPTRCG